MQQPLAALWLAVLWRWTRPVCSLLYCDLSTQSTLHAKEGQGPTAAHSTAQRGCLTTSEALAFGCVCCLHRQLLSPLWLDACLYCWMQHGVARVDLQQQQHVPKQQADSSQPVGAMACACTQLPCASTQQQLSISASVPGQRCTCCVVPSSSTTDAGRAL